MGANDDGESETSMAENLSPNTNATPSGGYRPLQSPQETRLSQQQQLKQHGIDSKINLGIYHSRGIVSFYI